MVAESAAVVCVSVLFAVELVLDWQLANAKPSKQAGRAWPNEKGKRIEKGMK